MQGDTKLNIDFKTEISNQEMNSWWDPDWTTTTTTKMIVKASG